MLSSVFNDADLRNKGKRKKMFVEPPAIYLHKSPVDFRESINGLSVIVEDQMKRMKKH